ncbi:MAG: non-ribosomal peptide synthetase, partial [Thermoanaerobaculia bacterium]
MAELSRREGVTPFMTLLAGFVTLLHRYSGQEDPCVGTPVAGRTRTATEPLIGFFVNTLVLRADLSGDPTFRELLARVRRKALSAYAHQDLPFERLVEELQPKRDLSRQPLFQAMFALQSAPVPAVDLPGLRLSPLTIETSTSKFDLSLEVAESPEGLRATFEYATDLFDEERIARMAVHFQRLLQAAVADPARRISALPVLTDAERHRILVEWQGTTASVACDRVPQLGGSSDAPAVVTEEGLLTYRALEARANRLARRLGRLGVGPDVLVAVRVDRSPDLVAAVLGVLKAGGAYVPIDPEYPQERAAFILRDTSAPLLLTPARWADAVPREAARLVPLEEALEGDDEPAPEHEAEPEHLAYVVYTSGTTGRPKGVPVRRAGLANHAVAMADAFGLGPGDRTLQFCSMAFDVFAEEVFPTLLRGASLVLRPGGAPPAVDDFIELLERRRVTV